jgi:hypothetical protein
MGFNKRYFTTAYIESHAKNGSYESFLSYMLNPDACMFDDEASRLLWNSFADGDEETRRSIYESLKSK